MNAPSFLNSSFFIRIATSEKQIGHCFAVMNELRLHLKSDRFLTRIRSLQQGGYNLAYLEVDGEAVAVAGYRFCESLARGHFLYVDDLVTRRQDQGKGYGQKLFTWLVETARTHQCDSLHLDSGVEREAAHLFYAHRGMTITGHHFRLALPHATS